ncbi:hypothetical protein DPMN_008023 [Dreissena polymorpha]|uniref:Uncharacterized protein n=1 Tax=Dreissena polymorpha TaxID=45954 RepID=A0A9D4MZK4_DREPO|nr:hypothetical protein DPMN_008023 [Dreissena polymorpha]
MHTKQLMCLLVVAAVLLASAPVVNARYRYGGSSDSSDSDDYNGGWGRPAGWRRGLGRKWGGNGGYGGTYYGK